MGVPSIFHTFLKNGGSSSMAVDGTTPVTFSLTASGRTMVVVRMIVHIEDTGTFADTSYGAVAGPLTNGILLRVNTANESANVDLLDGSKITSTFEWSRYCYDTVVITPGAGAKTAVVRWTFGKYAGPYGGLVLEPGESLECVIQDNLSDLTEHMILCEGYYK